MRVVVRVVLVACAKQPLASRSVRVELAMKASPKLHAHTDRGALQALENAQSSSFRCHSTGAPAGVLLFSASHLQREAMCVRSASRHQNAGPALVKTEEKTRTDDGTYVLRTG